MSNKFDFNKEIFKTYYHQLFLNIWRPQRDHLTKQQQLKGVHDISRVFHLSGSFYILPLSLPVAGSTSCRHHQLQAPPVAGTTSCRHHQLQAPPVAGSTSCKHHQLQAPPVAGTTSCRQHHQLQALPVAGSTTSCRQHHQLQAPPPVAGIISNCRLDQTFSRSLQNFPAPQKKKKKNRPD